jgi:uncharacterized protein
VSERGSASPGPRAPLRAPHVLDVTYRRGVGGSCERFLAGLARGELWGSRAADGRVIVPPVDLDPVTGTATGEFVRVADSGVVRSWTWVATPLPEHGRDRPFAFALIQLDGADSSLFHVVEVDDVARMATGMRVRADWRGARSGSVRDIRTFLPVQPPGRPAGRPPGPAPAAAPPGTSEPEKPEVVSEVRISYTYEPGLTLSGFLHALAERRIEGGRCPSCSKVYVPPRVRCPACGTGPMTPVPVGDRGTIVSFTVVSSSSILRPASVPSLRADDSIPVADAGPEPPFAWAWIQLDGADVPFAHLLGGMPVADVRVGQRVQAVWVAADRLAPTWESIGHFAPVPA